jgi:hypothetical protein
LRATTALRWTGAYWLLPTVFALGVYIGLTNPAPEQGYLASEFSAASRSVILLGPLLASAIAFHAGGVIRFIAVSRASRSPRTALLGVYWPILAGGPAAGVLAAVSVVRALPSDPSSAAVVLVMGATLLGSALFGLLLSRAFTRIVAVPLAAGACFAWLALPASGPNSLMRNLNSAFVVCCAPEQAPAKSLIFGSGILLLVLAVGTALLVSSSTWPAWGRLRSLIAATAVLSAAAASGALAATAQPGQLNMLAVEPRSATSLECRSDDGTEVCLWPEHAEMLDEAVGAARAVNDGLAELNINPVGKFTEDSHDPKGVSITANSYSRPSDIIFSAAQGVMLRVVSDCAAVPASDAFNTTLALLAALTGLDANELKVRLPTESVEASTALLKSSPTELQSYVVDALQKLSSQCSG